MDDVKWGFEYHNDLLTKSLRELKSLLEEMKDFDSAESEKDEIMRMSKFDALVRDIQREYWQCHAYMFLIKFGG